MLLFKVVIMDVVIQDMVGQFRNIVLVYAMFQTYLQMENQFRKDV